MTKVDKVLRKFKLRNGAIVEEATESMFDGSPIISERGYQDEYIVLTPCPDHEGGLVGRPITLRMNKDGAPRGGAFGKEFDIVEELLQSTQVKE